MVATATPVRTDPGPAPRRRTRWLTAAAVVALCWVALVPTRVVPAAAVAISAPFLLLLITDGVARRVVLRNARRRTRESAFVVLGALLGTAMVTSSAVAGASLRASIRRSAATQLGPIDEIVTPGGVVPHLAGVAGTLPILALQATIVTKTFVARVSPVQVVEIDFAQAARLGGDAAATGINGSTPTGDDAFMGADLAQAVSGIVGDRIAVDAGGRSTTLVVSRILPRLGIAALESLTGGGGPSLDLFVPPGTVATLQPGVHVGPVTAVANVDGVKGTAAVVAGLERFGDTVIPVKEDLLAAADRSSRRLTRLFDTFGLFGGLAGLLLLGLTFVMFTAERHRSTGLLRALGIRRSRSAAMFCTEGWIYAVVAAAAGAAVGLGLGRLIIIVGQHSIGGAEDVELRFSAPATDVRAGFLIGLVVALAVVVATSAVAARRNLILAIRGLPDPSRPARGRPLAAAALVAAAAGGVAAGGALRAIGAPAALGAAVIVAYPRRVVLTVVAALVGVWSLAAVTVIPAAFRQPGVAVLLGEAFVPTGALLVIAVANPLRAPGGSLSVRLALAYPRARPGRSALVIAMYATVAFTISLVVSVSALFAHDVSAAARRLGGSAAVVVASNPTRPVAVADVASQPGVTGVVVTDAVAATVDARPVTLVGFDDSFVGHGSPPLIAGGAALLRTVAGDPSLALVGADLGADPFTGLAGTPPRVGNTVTVRDPTTGAARALTIAGIVQSASWDGADHIFVSRAVTAALARPAAGGNLLFVSTDGTIDDDVLAAVINGTHLANGADASSFRALAASGLDVQRSFLALLDGYSWLGLLAAAVGVGVVTARAVDERRRQIGVLRALGLGVRGIRRMFVVEALGLAAEGVAVGTISGVLLAWRLGAGGVLGEPLAFNLAWPGLLVLIAATFAVSLLAAAVPAGRAAHLPPAVAIRSSG